MTMRRHARVIALFVGCLLLLITRSASSQPLPMNLCRDDL